MAFRYWWTGWNRKGLEDSETVRLATIGFDVLAGVARGDVVADMSSSVGPEEVTCDEVDSDCSSRVSGTGGIVMLTSDFESEGVEEIDETVVKNGAFADREPCVGLQAPLLVGMLGGLDTFRQVVIRSCGQGRYRDGRWSAWLGSDKLKN